MMPEEFRDKPAVNLCVYVGESGVCHCTSTGADYWIAVGIPCRPSYSVGGGAMQSTRGYPHRSSPAASYPQAKLDSVFTTCTGSIIRWLCWDCCWSCHVSWLMKALRLHLPPFSSPTPLTFPSLPPPHPALSCGTRGLACLYGH